MLRILLATNNAGKLKEMAQIVKEEGFGKKIQLVAPKDLNLDLDVDETGSTFFENAYLKAKAFADKTGLPTIADDSGLVVDALDGKPGIYSARWGKTDKDRINKVLESLKGVPFDKRQAAFVAVMVFYHPKTLTTIKTVGKMEGFISDKPIGQGGFGYDPIMFIPALGKTVAQLTPAQKNQLSHRGKALRELLPLIMEQI
ncbi:MAG: RdgB/HAM1 family non-canonical purine NTP pyrophosphatase [bacterium]|nr:RdgB/HAM1 family non-canonical purine NTP pyrophosphatase [bacterium]